MTFRYASYANWCHNDFDVVVEYILRSGDKTIFAAHDNLVKLFHVAENEEKKNDYCDIEVKLINEA